LLAITTSHLRKFLLPAIPCAIWLFLIVTTSNLNFPTNNGEEISSGLVLTMFFIPITLIGFITGFIDKRTGLILLIFWVSISYRVLNLPYGNAAAIFGGLILLTSVIINSLKKNFGLIALGITLILIAMDSLLRLNQISETPTPQIVLLFLMIGSTYYAFLVSDRNTLIKGMFFFIFGLIAVIVSALETYEIVDTSNFLFYLFPSLTSLMLLLLILNINKPGNQKLRNLASIEFFLLTISIMVSAIDVVR
jgi:hypothetical protein